MITGEALIKHRLKLYEDASPLMKPHYATNVSFTCDTCVGNDACERAFDAYNTDGDCLMEK